MEESEKRRERLKAMRMGATQAEDCDRHDTLTDPSYLLNPLNTPPPAPPVPRFDYYTDPMSAFSGNKRRGSSSSHNPLDNFATPLSGLRNPCMTPSPAPANQFQVNYPPHQGSSEISEIPSPAPQPCSWRSPVGMSRMTNPFSVHSPVSVPGLRNPYMTPSPAPANQFQVNYPLHEGFSEMPLPSPQPGSWRSPVGMTNPYSAHSPVSVPGIWNGSGGSSGYFPSQNASRGGFSSPSFGRGSPRTNPGRGSPSAYSGRGGNWRVGNSTSPHSGRSSGGGRGFHDYASARERPERFYSKLMILDPWCNLQPVVGNILVPTGSLNTLDPQRSWLPGSVSTKKAKSAETTNEFRSQSSLAEYLALSFNEAVNETSDV